MSNKFNHIEDAVQTGMAQCELWSDNVMEV